jgi:hypothetical protein
MAGAGVWCEYCSLTVVVKLPVSDGTRSYGAGHYVAPTVL